jgi:RHS repeat-associated protein
LSDLSSPWRFCGRRAFAGLYHFDKRDYDPILGRWLTPDPLGLIDGPNLYAYVKNNPLSYVDPYGLFLMQTGDFFSGMNHAYRNGQTCGFHSYMYGDYTPQTEWGVYGGYVGEMASLLMMPGKVAVTKGLQYGTKGAQAAWRVFNAERAASKMTIAQRAVSNMTKTASVSPEHSLFAKTFKTTAKTPYTLNRFERAAYNLSETGQNNIRILRNWAKSKGWEKFPGSGKPEKWGIKENGKQKWYLKIKPIESFTEGLESGSHIPRFDARTNQGTYINPFTGEVGKKEVGTHLLLEFPHY